MAFERTRQIAPVASNDNWKSDAFLNFRFRRPDGTYFKLGDTSSLKLKETRKMDRALLDKVRKGNKEEVLAQLLEMIEIDLVFADESAEAKGDLGF